MVSDRAVPTKNMMNIIGFIIIIYLVGYAALKCLQEAEWIRELIRDIKKTFED